MLTGSATARFADSPGVSGSVCDRAARQLADGPGAIAYHLTEGFPAHLVHPARTDDPIKPRIESQGVDLQNEAEARDPMDPAYAGKFQALQHGQAFLEYSIEIQREYGISNFF